MNEPLSQIEQELAALQPAQISPELEQRIEKRIAEGKVAVSLLSSPSAKRWVGLVVGAIAASIVVMLIAWRLNDDGPSGAPIVQQQQRSEPRIESQQERPTLIALDRALATSGETLEKLLDDHARSGSAAATGMGVPRAFARGASHSLFNTGEL
jgi:hypothetical protein